MRRIGITLLAAVAASLSAAAQTTPSQPQSARQALIEMFTGKGKNDFTKHLPSAALSALVRKGETPETSLLFRVSGAVRGLSMQGEKVETFDTGPNIMTTENRNTHERVEIAVENDSLSDEEDEIELSVHVYKNGEPQALPVVPRVIFTLKQEKEIWRVTEVTAAAHVPLEDPDYLKGLRKQQDETNESTAQMRVNMIAQAETNYAANHPEAGFICGFAGLNPSAEGDLNTFPGLAKDESNGYRFSLSGCSGKPAKKYRLTAVPLDPESQVKAFCVDQTGTLKSIASSDSASCFTQGTTVTVVNGAIDQAPAD